MAGQIITSLHRCFIKSNMAAILVARLYVITHEFSKVIISTIDKLNYQTILNKKKKKLNKKYRCKNILLDSTSNQQRSLLRLTFDRREKKKRKRARERERRKKSNYIRSPVVIGPQAAHSHSPQSLIHRESRSRVNSRAREGEGRER